MSENPIFSYTHRDYESSRKEGLSKIPIISRGVWTDLNATDPGIVLLDYVHALVDMIQFYQDHQAMESFISTAKERENIFRLAKQLNYKIPSAKGATVEVKFMTRYAYSSPIKISKHTELATPTGIKFLTNQEAYIPAKGSSVAVVCSQGELREKIYKGTGISRLSTIEDAENQYTIIEDKNVDIDSITIKDNSNKTWKSIENIVFSTSTDRVFEAELLPDDTIKIKFGDGERGIVPTSEDLLTISYVATLAEEGRIGAESLTIINSNITTAEGNYVDIYCTNYSSSVGGSSSLSSEEIVKIAPGIIKSQGRAVTLSDFEHLATSVDGVSKAIAYDINTAPDLCLHHEVKVLIIPDSNVLSSEELVSNVHKFLYNRMIPPTNLQVLSPSGVPVNIKIRVKLLDRLIEGGVEYEIAEKVSEYFKNRNGFVGEKFYATELVPIIQNISGVRYVIEITPNESPEISKLSVVTLGDLIIETE